MQALDEIQRFVEESNGTDIGVSVTDYLVNEEELQAMLKRDGNGGLEMEDNLSYDTEIDETLYLKQDGESGRLKDVKVFLAPELLERPPQDYGAMDWAKVLEGISHYVKLHYTYQEFKRVPSLLELEVQAAIDRLVFFSYLIEEDTEVSAERILLLDNDHVESYLYNMAAELALNFWMALPEGGQNQVKVLREFYRLQGEMEQREFIRSLGHANGIRITFTLPENSNGKNHVPGNGSGVEHVLYIPTPLAEKQGLVPG